MFSSIVNENGASIYSVTEDAKAEFPDLDPNLRSAVSIARRLQDPLVELVKIEPKHIGVGMYQVRITKLRCICVVRLLNASLTQPFRILNRDSIRNFFGSLQF